MLLTTSRHILSILLLTNSALGCIIAKFNYDQKNSRELSGNVYVDDAAIESNLRCGIAITNALADGDGYQTMQCLNGWEGKIGRDFGDYWWVWIKQEWAPGQFVEREFYLDVNDKGGDKRELVAQIYGCPSGPNWQETGIKSVVEYACADGKIVGDVNAC